MYGAYEAKRCFFGIQFFLWFLLSQRLNAARGCREPSWLENMEFRAEKAIECENITKIILTFDGILLPLELQAGPLRRSVRKPVTDRRIYKKVGATNSQIEWLRQAIFSDQMDIPSHYGSD
ncbi:MAG: hypothetical protein WB816_00915 [Methylocystis sp.]